MMLEHKIFDPETIFAVLERDLARYRVRGRRAEGRIRA
jgi:hypothetical protein